MKNTRHYFSWRTRAALDWAAAGAFGLFCGSVIAWCCMDPAEDFTTETRRHGDAETRFIFDGGPGDASSSLALNGAGAMPASSPGRRFFSAVGISSAGAEQGGVSTPVCRAGVIDGTGAPSRAAFAAACGGKLFTEGSEGNEGGGR